jgi:hypothetical protein
MEANPANPMIIPGNIMKGRRLLIRFVKKVANDKDKRPVN